MKNRKREICTSGTVRDADGNILIYSANDREGRGNVGIIRSPIRASTLPLQVLFAVLHESDVGTLRRFAVVPKFGSVKRTSRECREGVDVTKMSHRRPQPAASA